MKVVTGRMCPALKTLVYVCSVMEWEHCWWEMQREQDLFKTDCWKRLIRTICHTLVRVTGIRDGLVRNAV